ncbi:MAG: DUF4124 domain-containing protein [Thiotrichaceae bacterium]|nr:DUF4124 domain-containing protein [Thiotrichaceae bacterium]
MRYLMLFFLLFSTTVYADKLYQWIDEEGTTHYTQTPPPSYIGAEEREFNTPKVKKSAAVEQTENIDPLQALKDARAQNCKQLRQNLAKLTSNQELVSLKTGNETDEEMTQMKPMTIEEREQEIAKTQGIIDEFCQNVPVEEDAEQQAEPEVEQE